jgi:hypothetical protein
VSGFLEFGIIPNLSIILLFFLMRNLGLIR